MKSETLIKEVSVDRLKIENYIKTYSGCSGSHGFENILAPWSKNKKMLYTLLGGQLSVDIPIKFDRDKSDYIKALGKLYSFSKYSGEVLAPTRQSNPFVKEFLFFFRKEEYHKQAKALLNPFGIVSSSLDIPSQGMTFENGEKSVKITPGMKPMKAIGKIVNLYGKENFPSFNSFREKHSTIMSDKKEGAVLTLSIHPLDFMTMSDNANNWSSCTSWREEGCYRVGTLEVMNSNNVLIGYIKSKEDMSFGNKGYVWNNKSWRSLCYVTKDIILSGKAYPYVSEKLSKIMVAEVAKLAAKNLSWYYKYDVQRYYDMVPISDEGQMYYTRNYFYGQKNIFFRGGFMYNDFLVTGMHDAPFWCVRNRVEKTKIISYSGVAYCLECGKPLTSANTTGSSLVCHQCLKEKCCTACHKYVLDEDAIIIGAQRFCKSCASYLVQCPECGDPKMSLASARVIHDEEAYKIIKSGKLNSDEGRLLNLERISSIKICFSCLENLIAKGRINYISCGYSRYRYLDRIVPIDHPFVQSHMLCNIARYEEGVPYTGNSYESISNYKSIYEVQLSEVEGQF